MKGRAKITAALLLAFSYLLALGLVTQGVEFCGCGFPWLQTSLPSVNSLAGGWNSWLGNSWALGASSWSAPVMASASEADSGEPGADAPVFEEWRLEEGFAIEPLARVTADIDVVTHFSRFDREGSSAATLKLDCLEKLGEVEVVLSRHQLPEADAAPDLSPHVVVVTAELPKVEIFQQPLAPLTRNPGCPGSVKIFQRRSAT